MSRIRQRLTFANVVSVVALFVALGGGAYAITVAKKNSVVSKSIKNGQVKNKDLAKNAVISSKVKNGSLLNQDFASGQLPRGPTGPGGPIGATGARGATGPSTGPAGGDLTGSYPNPTIATGAVTANKLNTPAQFTSAGLPDAFGSCGTINGWVNWSPDVNERVGYYRDPTGVVHLQGTVAPCGSFPVEMFSLPPGYRPGHRQYFVVSRGPNMSATAVIEILEASAAPPQDGWVIQTSTIDQVSLDGVTFRCGPSGQNGCP